MRRSDGLGMAHPSLPTAGRRSSQAVNGQLHSLGSTHGRVLVGRPQAVQQLELGVRSLLSLGQARSVGRNLKTLADSAILHGAPQQRNSEPNQHGTAFAGLRGGEPPSMQLSTGLVEVHSTRTAASVAVHGKRISGLDGLRAVSVAIVFISHYAPVVFPQYPVLVKIFPGMFGVAIFFVISGLLISTLLLVVENLTLSPGRCPIFGIRAERYQV